MTTPKEALRGMRIIHRALCIGSVAFLSIVLYMIYINRGGQMSENDPDHEFMSYLFAGLAALMLLVQGIISSSAFKKGLQSIHAELTLDEKIFQYRKLLIQSWALMESVQFFAIVTFMLTAHPALVVVWGAAFWMMITNAPGKQRMIRNIDLSPAEEKSLDE